MKLSNVDKACSLAEARQDLLKLRTAVVTNPPTIAAGNACGPISICADLGARVLDLLLEDNAKALADIGVTDVHPWRMPQRPSETTPLELDRGAFLRQDR